MGGYQARSDRQSANAAEQRSEAQAPRASTAPLREGSRTASLLQLQQALDQSPRVRAQVILQRALDKRASAPAAAKKKPAREKPALQMKGIAINDDAGLEREADAMGRQALETGDSSGSTAIPGNQDMETSSPVEIDAPGRKRTKASSRRTIGLDPVQRIIIFNGKPSKKGVVPKALVHGNSDKDLKVLANSNTEHDLGTQGGAAAAPLIKAALERETKDTKVDVSKKSKEETIKPLIALKSHIAGEKSGTGGHLLDLMQKTHTNKLVYEGNKSDDGVWTCRWSLRKGPADKNKNQDTKDVKEDDLEFALKESTMFPASWNWERLVQELYGYVREGNKLVLKNGIKVHEAGDTFYPEV